MFLLTRWNPESLIVLKLSRKRRKRKSIKRRRVSSQRKNTQKWRRRRWHHPSRIKNLAREAAPERMKRVILLVGTRTRRIG